ncbi:MAG: hypothetical protein WD847_18770 [Pirellulales bacterium]
MTDPSPENIDDAEGRVDFLNPVPESLTGWTLAAGQPIEARSSTLTVSQTIERGDS